MFPFIQRAIPEHERIQGLILHYRMDNASGVVFDSSPNRDHGAAVGGVLRDQPGVLKKSFEFDGVDDEITNSTSQAITDLQNTAVFTVCFFAKTTGYNTGAALSIRDNSTTTKLFQVFPYWDATIGLRFYWNSTYLNTSSVYPVDDSWHHFCMSSVSTTEHRIIVDGVYLGQFTTNKKHSNTLDNINVGNWYSTVDHYDGGIDDLRIYNRALSDAEVAVLAGYST